MAGWQHQALINQLQDKREDSRREAAISLSRVGDGETLVPLFRMAADEDGGLWRATRDGELAEPEAPEPPFVFAHFAVRLIVEREGCWSDLRKALVDRDPAVRAEAAWSLGHIPTPSSEAEDNNTALKNALQDPEQIVVLQVVRSLVSLGQIQEGMLLPLLRNQDPLFRWTVINAFGSCDIGPRTLGFLVGILVNESESSAIRCAVINILSANPDPRLPGPLLGMLSDKNSNVRQSCALALGLLGANQAVTPLFQSLIDEDEMVRYAAGVALGLLGDSRTVPFLLRARKNGDMGIQDAANKAIARLGSDALPDLIQAMKEEQLEYRLDATDIIAGLKDPRSIVSLIESLLDEDIYLNVRKALLNIGSPAVEPLIFVAGNSDSPPVFQEKCLRLLVELDAKEALPTFIKLLTGSDIGIRILCARILGDSDEAKAKAPLNKILKRGDKEPDELIAEVLLSLAKLQDKKVYDSLIGNLNHMSSKVRGYSIAGLGELGNKDAVEPLIEKLLDPSQDNRTMMIQALAKLGDTRAVKPLMSILEEAKLQSSAGVKGGYMGTFAIKALATLGEASVVKLLLSDWEEELESAIESLGVAALPPLEQALQHDRDDHIRALAAEAIGVLSNPRSMGSLITALQDESDQVRTAAAWALNQLHTRGSLPALTDSAPAS